MITSVELDRVLVQVGSMTDDGRFICTRRQIMNFLRSTAFVLSSAIMSLVPMRIDRILPRSTRSRAKWNHLSRLTEVLVAPAFSTVSFADLLSVLTATSVVLLVTVVL